MNYKTTLIIAAIATTAFAALGSAYPMVGIAFASNGPNGPNGEEPTQPTFNNQQGDACNIGDDGSVSLAGCNNNQQGENSFFSGNEIEGGNGGGNGGGNN
jgi:hypothetical protein